MCVFVSRALVPERIFLATPADSSAMPPVAPEVARLAMACGSAAQVLRGELLRAVLMACAGAARRMRRVRPLLLARRGFVAIRVCITTHCTDARRADKVRELERETAKDSCRIPFLFLFCGTPTRGA